MSDPAAGARSAADAGGGLVRLGIGVLGPPSIWAIRISASYILVPYACWWGWIPALHLVTLVALLATAFIGWRAWSSWRAVGGGSDTELEEGAARTRFLAILGMLSSALFFAVILAEGLANLLVDPCQTAGAPIA